MRHHLHAVIAEHENPTHASKRDVLAQLIPIMKLGAAVQRQMGEYEILITEAQLADETGELHAKYEHVRQTFARAKKDSDAFVALGRDLVQRFHQLDRYIAEAKGDMSRPGQGPIADASTAPVLTEVADGAQATE